MNFTAVVMAGGKSSRMGTDKAFIEFRGRPLWEHQESTLAALEPDQILISARRGQRFDTDRARVVYDDFPNIGPLGGLVSAFKQAPTKRIVVLGVDFPLVTPRFIKQNLLLQAFFESGVAYEIDGVLQPLVALYPKSVLLLAQECLRRREYAARDFLQAAIDQGAMEAYALRSSYRPLFFNVNTPEDLERLRALDDDQMSLPILD